MAVQFLQYFTRSAIRHQVRLIPTVITFTINNIELYPPRCFMPQADDFTGDCKVDNKDLEEMANECLTTGPKADLNADGNVDFKDYALMADNWLILRLWP
jgi:hypothetical protein